MNKKEIIKNLLDEIEGLKDKKGYIQAGSPRFNGLFGRDSLIVAWQLLKHDPLVAKNTLSILASLQGKNEDRDTGEEPGKILHEYYPKSTPDKWWNEHKEKVKWLKRGKPVYMSIDSTPLFLIVFEKYLNYTKDFDLAKKLLPSIKKAYSWMINYSNDNGFLEYERKTSEGLFHQAWKDSNMEKLKVEPPISVAEAQGYKYIALKSTANIMKKLNCDPKEIERLTKEANFVKKSFNQFFWIKEENHYALALDGDGKQRGKASSNPGHLLFTGIVEKRRSDLVVSRLFKKDMWTPYGIRTYSSDEPEFEVLSYHIGTVWPHDNWIISQGLKKMGYNKEYNKIKKGLLKAYEKLGFIPELYGVDKKNNLVEYENACKIQAWSLGALLNLLLE